VETSIELQRELSREITAELGGETLRSYHRADARHTLTSLAHIWLAIALGFWLGGRVLELPVGLAIPVGIALALFMATRINALNVLVHEGSHHALAAGRRLNTRLTNWGAGYWILFDEESYAALHGRHHRLLNEAGDPDRPLYTIGRRRRDLALGLLADLCWVSIARRSAVYREHGESRTGLPARSPQKIAANALLLVALLAVHGFPSGGIVYALFWVVPLLSFYPMIIRLRLIAEHFAPEVLAEDGSAVFVARTSVCGPLEHYLVGAKMEYHFEHHLFPGIPYHQLERMHAELVRRRFFETNPRVVADRSLSGGYLTYWKRLLRSDWFVGAGAGASTRV
jgi:fatty acid desaturase